ncbi:hypothetical protein LTR36_000224 [Oleoguttula mirabilis]|uniref:F-box domain-containing protein n=1 Tax=Oleoguttula mirabilis TaxID=1507867 RepID=A0AAV9JY63_9PEZI|nr:hypothetical protein LTR36_000224 [Oleoguttula mirabilis]
MADSKLPYLPPEIYGAVLSWIRRSSDLKNIILTTKKMRDLAMPVLYNTVHIIVERCDRDVLEPLLVHGHPGHQYIRNLITDCDEEGHDEASLSIVRALVRAIPQDRLRFFRCMLMTNLDSQVVYLLASRQRRIEVLAMGPVAENVLRNYDDPQIRQLALQSWPTKVMHLVIPWRVVRLEDLGYYSALLDHNGEACKRLTIRTNCFGPTDKDSKPFDELADAGEPSNTLFQHCIRSKPRRTMRLESLSLSSQDLHHITNNLCAAIELPKLQSLYIWECRQADALLARLIDVFRKEQPQPLKLVVAIKYSKPSPRLVPGLLRALAGLEHLIVSHWCSANEDTKFDVRCLETHKSTLRDLYLGTGENRSRTTPLFVMPEKDIEWLVANVQGLKQLAIAMPKIRMADALSDDWGVFGEVMACLAKLESLSVFRILTWPTAHNSCKESSSADSPDEPFSKDTYLRQLDAVASKIARFFNVTHRHRRRVRMSVLIFGSKGYKDCVGHVDGWSIHMHWPVAYKLRAALNGKGEVEHYAERVEARMMMYEEPLGCVVSNDYDQGLAPAMFE